MISIDSVTAAVHYNPEFYLVKHFSHFIQPGDRRSELAFRNPDGSIVLVLHNEGEGSDSTRVNIGTQVVELEIAGHAFGTVVVEQI